MCRTSGGEDGCAYAREHAQAEHSAPSACDAKAASAQKQWGGSRQRTGTRAMPAAPSPVPPINPVQASRVCSTPPLHPSARTSSPPGHLVMSNTTGGPTTTLRGRA